ncbi:unnamed protein product [Darwinula stevensoni]|uniref:XK-related protein n=1 Tax=Darwinula stevensoni TaxID=69355 RepID=A0A7R9AI78_9CRUS|nr:unnamed protein product [Darwinula stevensoni]CAG0906114.1 unnamed protein product [Darwinula stevensoni]
MSEPVCASDSSAGSMKKPEELTVVDAPAGARVDEIDGLPKNLRFALYDAFFIVYSIFTYLLDIGSDIWLAHRYYVLEDYAFFGLTIGIVIFTSLVLTVLSWVWYKDDAKGDPVSPRDWRLRILLLLLQLAPVLRDSSGLD